MRPTDAGGYTVILSNVIGVITSTVATLTISPALTNSGPVDATFQPNPGADDLIRVVVLQPDGKAIIGGLFTDFAGTPRNRIARVNPDGSLDDTFDPGPPVFLMQPTSQTVPAGRELILAVQTAGCATFQWRFNGSDVVGATNAVVALPNPRSTNTGAYRVIAHLDSTTATSEVAAITVGPEPWRPGSISLDFYPGLAPTNSLTAWAVANDGEVLAAMAILGADGMATNRLVP